MLTYTDWMKGRDVVDDVPNTPDTEPKVYAEPLLFNLRRLIDEYGYGGVLECLEVCFGPNTKPDPPVAANTEAE